jgi:hypothetical protein
MPRKFRWEWRPAPDSSDDDGSDSSDDDGPPKHLEAIAAAKVGLRIWQRRWDELEIDFRLATTEERGKEAKTIETN